MEICNPLCDSLFKYMSLPFYHFFKKRRYLLSNWYDVNCVNVSTSVGSRLFALLPPILNCSKISTAAGFKPLWSHQPSSSEPSTGASTSSGSFFWSSVSEWCWCAKLTVGCSKKNQKLTYNINNLERWKQNILMEMKAPKYSCLITYIYYSYFHL